MNELGGGLIGSPPQEDIMRTRFTNPQTPLERLVLALLAVVVLLPTAGVFLMLAMGGSVFGVRLGELGEVPFWMAAWLVFGALLFVVVAIWMVSLLIDWLNRRMGA
jgi:hypothetical protein